MQLNLLAINPNEIEGPIKLGDYVSGSGHDRGPAQGYVKSLGFRWLVLGKTAAQDYEIGQFGSGEFAAILRNTAQKCQPTQQKELFSHD